MQKYIIYAIGFLAVTYPLGVRWQNSPIAFGSGFLETLFPYFGLLAFTLLWIHSMLGVFEPWLRKYISFDKFVDITAVIILVSIILHPLLLLMSVKFNISNVFLYYGATYIWFAIIAWILLITYDIGKALKGYAFFSRNWQNILTISTIGFLLAFFHSLAIGSDLQQNPLRAIWIFYGVTAILATIYTYGVKRFIKHKT